MVDFRMENYIHVVEWCYCLVFGCFCFFSFLTNVLLVLRIPQHIGKAILKWKHCRGSMEYPFLIAKWWKAGRSSKRRPRAGTTGKSGRYAHTIVTQTPLCCPWVHLTKDSLKRGISSSFCVPFHWHLLSEAEFFRPTPKVVSQFPSSVFCWGSKALVRVYFIMV